jgi:hypothetical protein
MDKFRKEILLFWENPKSVQYPIAARDFICKSICPKLYGMQVVKLALLITLIGGVSSEAYEVDDEEEGTDRPDSFQIGAKPDDDEPDAFRLQRDEPRTNNTATAYYGETPRAKSRQKKQAQKVKTRRRDQSHLLIVGRYIQSDLGFSLLPLL